MPRGQPPTWRNSGAPRPRAPHPHPGLEIAEGSGIASRVNLIGEDIGNEKIALSITPIHAMRGGILNRVGATGPHLHWNVSLNDARVDPAIFIGMFKP